VSDLDAKRHVRGVQAWMCSDLWTAMGLPPAEFDGYFARNGFGNTWAALLGSIRGPLRCGKRIDVSWCVLAPHSEDAPCYGAEDVGVSEPLPEATNG
jgi:hypothetical protein